MIMKDLLGQFVAIASAMCVAGAIAFGGEGSSRVAVLIKNAKELVTNY